ncbi:MAG: S1/P1 nuclease [Zoogloeaceae bacterium]|nr:S1/P1 nuclease [Zoogloeaceae bacterium]
MAFSPVAPAWNAAGHRLSAVIAWQQLDEPTRGVAGEILRHHPDHTLWIERARKADRNVDEPYAAFVEASTWPDDIRRDHRFYKPGEPETPLLPGFPDMQQHQDWHYVNLPVGAYSPRKRPGGALDRQLPLLIERIRQPAQTKESERAYALAWLIHLLGDAHQPLHVGSRIDDSGDDDSGGNALWIENFFHPRRSSMTLHAYWDDLPGPPWLRGRQLEATAERLNEHIEQPQQAGNVDQWLSESRKLADTVAYEGLEGEVPVLSTRYHERATETARQRVALAGKRLGLLLKELLKP